MLGHDAAGRIPGPAAMNGARAWMPPSEPWFPTQSWNICWGDHMTAASGACSASKYCTTDSSRGAWRVRRGTPLDRNLGLGPDALIKRLIPQRVVAGLGEDLDRPVGASQKSTAPVADAAESVTGSHDHGVDVAGHGRIGEQRFEPGDGGIGEGHGRDRNPCRSPPPVDAADWRCWLTMPPNGLPWRP